MQKVTLFSLKDDERFYYVLERFLNNFFHLFDVFKHYIFFVERFYVCVSIQKQTVPFVFRTTFILGKLEKSQQQQQRMYILSVLKSTQSLRRAVRATVANHAQLRMSAAALLEKQIERDQERPQDFG